MPAADTAFFIGFTIFVVAFVVLIVLTVRFTLQRGALARRNWLAGRPGAWSEPPDGADGSEPEPPGPVTALVLSGGGTRGAAQVGMLQVLAEYGIVPDFIFGTSVGAVNGAAYAGDPTVHGVDHLVAVWRGLNGEDVYPQRLGHGPWRFLQQRESIHANTGLRKVIEDGLVFERLEDTVVPFEVAATSLDTGQERWFTSGPAVEAIMASAAIPAIFPPVVIDGEQLIDGGVVDNVPISRAIDRGATRIIVLLCGPPAYVPTPARRPVEAMVNALFISVHARFSRELARLPDGVEVAVCSGGDAHPKDYTDFSDTEALIQAGRAEALAVLSRHGFIDRREIGRRVPVPPDDPPANGRDPGGDPDEGPEPPPPPVSGAAPPATPPQGRTGGRSGPVRRR